MAEPAELFLNAVATSLGIANETLDPVVFNVLVLAVSSILFNPAVNLELKA